MPDNFDTVALMDTLIEGGFSERQAKALAAALFQLIESHLVTRSYLDLRLAELQGLLQLQMAQMKAELIQVMLGLLVVQTGTTAVLFKLMH